MYPILRMLVTIRSERAATPLRIGEIHHSHTTCLPWDIDPWRELNNGRTLTLYDLGRVGMFLRLGLVPTLKRKQWSGTVAGSSVRYRKRVRMFDRIEMRSRITCWDDRFVYAEQSMWVREVCTSHGLLRIAVTDANGIVPPAHLAKEMGIAPQSPPIPPWIAAWIEAEAQRPWPPMDEPANLS